MYCYCSFFLFFSSFSSLLFFFFFNDTATTEIYTLSLHDPLPILFDTPIINQPNVAILGTGAVVKRPVRSEEHTSELQSHVNLVCRLLLEKKKKKPIPQITNILKTQNNIHSVQLLS